MCVDCYCNCSQILKHAENSYRPQHLHICEINLEGHLPDGTVVDKHDHLKIQIGDVEVSRHVETCVTISSSMNKVVPLSNSRRLSMAV
jgi:hypothetical protein